MPAAQDRLDSPFRQAMLYVVRALGEVGVMKLEKTLYLADLEHFRTTGRRVTGARWLRHRFGPMAKSIVPSTRLMSGHEITVTHEAVGPYESDVYRPGPAPRFEPRLADDERASLDRAIELGRALTGARLARLSYNTTPMLVHLKREAEEAREIWDATLSFDNHPGHIAEGIGRPPEADQQARLAFKRAELDRVEDLQQAALATANRS